MKCFALTCAAVLLSVCQAHGQEELAKNNCKPAMKPCKPPVKGCDMPANPASDRSGASGNSDASSACPVLFDRGEPISSSAYPAGYSLGARIDTKDWDFFMSGAFTYWSASQDGMDLAVSSSFTPGATPTFFNPADAVVLFQKFSYKPGFKLALGGGTDFDQWAYAAHYTWYRSRTTVSTDRPPTPPVGLGQTGDWAIQSWNPQAANTNALSLNSSWKASIDLVDAQLSRPYYLGTNLILEPFFGGQAGWIRQSLRLSYVAIPADTVSNPVPRNPVVSHNNSHCWGIGPRIGLNTNWLMGAGFRFIGSGEANLLYTSYRTVAQRVDAADSADSNALSVKISKLNVLRPNAGLNLGLGWGMYADQNRWHFDLSATYDYYVFFSQNMMRYLADLNASVTGASPSNLYLQGVTATARFDF